MHPPRSGPGADTGTGPPAPGWYPAPDNSPQWWWWTGHSWAPPTPGPPPPAPALPAGSIGPGPVAAPPRHRFLITALIVLVGLAAVAVPKVQAWAELLTYQRERITDPVVVDAVTVACSAMDAEITALRAQHAPDPGSVGGYGNETFDLDGAHLNTPRGRAIVDAETTAGRRMIARVISAAGPAQVAGDTNAQQWVDDWTLLLDTRDASAADGRQRAVPLDGDRPISTRIGEAAPTCELPFDLVDDLAAPGDPNAYAFLIADPGGAVRWNPCRPITYSVNAASAQPWVVEDLREALYRLERVTGLDFERVADHDWVPDGTEDIAPTRAQVAADLVVTWADEDDAPVLAGNVLGVARPQTTSMPGGAWITSASVIINVDGFTSRPGQFGPGFADGETHGAVVLHELAHAVGLDHIADPNQLMNDTATPLTNTGFGAGDRAGLRQLGREAGCP